MGQHDNHWCELGFAEPTAVYKGRTQIARWVTEAWVALHGFCPNCPADHLPQLPNNAPVADVRCGEAYELKAKQGRRSHRFLLPMGEGGAQRRMRVGWSER